MSDAPTLCEFPNCRAPAITGVTTPDADRRTVWLCPPHYREHQIASYEALVGWVTMPRGEGAPQGVPVPTNPNGHRKAVKLHRARKGQRG